MRLLGKAMSPLIGVFMALACASPPDSGQPSADSPTTQSASGEPWYVRERVLDLTGDGRPDTARLRADGTRPDSLRIALTLLVDGQEAHQEKWQSSWELVDPNPADLVRPRLDEYIREQLDAALASVRIKPFDTTMLRDHMVDTAAVARLKPSLRTQVLVSYGYESTSALGWDPEGKRFVVLWACC